MSKILLYTENYAVGGGNKYLADIINSIPAEFEVFLTSNIGGISNKDFDLIKRNYTYKPLDVFTFAKIDNRFFVIKKTFPTLYKIIRKIVMLILVLYYQKKNHDLFYNIINQTQPSLVFSCNGGFPAALSCLDLVNTCEKLNKKCILSIVSTPQKKSIVDFYYGNMSSFSTKIIVNTDLAKNKLINERGFKSENIEVIHNCVDKADDFKAWNFEKKPGERLFAYVGRIEKNKGCYILLDAFKKINADQNVRLLMIGEGVELDKIKKYSSSIGLNDRVIFTGYLDVNIYSILSMIDVFVFPSLWEGFPYSILEAMNAGKIIITTNVGGIPEAIANDVDGLLVSPNNIQELYVAMLDVVLNYEKYQKLGINAKIKVEEKFKFDTFQKDITRLIQSSLLDSK